MWTATSSRYGGCRHESAQIPGHRPLPHRRRAARRGHTHFSPRLLQRHGGFHTHARDRPHGGAVLFHGQRLFRPRRRAPHPRLPKKKLHHLPRLHRPVPAHKRLCRAAERAHAGRPLHAALLRGHLLPPLVSPRRHTWRGALLLPARKAWAARGLCRRCGALCLRPPGRQLLRPRRRRPGPARGARRRHRRHRLHAQRAFLRPAVHAPGARPAHGQAPAPLRLRRRARRHRRAADSRRPRPAQPWLAKARQHVPYAAVRDVFPLCAPRLCAWELPALGC